MASINRQIFACVALLSGILSTLLLVETGFAQSPFGVGTPEVGSVPQDGIMRYIAEQQGKFYRELTATVRTLKEDGTALWLLMGMSFLYGIFHAAGPGHGKVVMSSYVLANNETAKRGAVLCFLSSMVQAAVAVVLIGVLAVILNATSLVIDDATQMLERASYAMIAALGGLLLWRALRQLAGTFSAPVQLAGAHSHDHHHADHHHHHDHDENCGCGHAHAPSPQAADVAAQSLKSGDLRGAAMAVISVGLRPCTGALIVLVFALAQGLFWAGVLSAFVMGIGTAITVTTLMFLAVGTRRVAYGLTGEGSVAGTRVLAGIQLIAALAVLVLGLTLLAAAFA